MTTINDGPKEGTRRYEVRLTGNARHYIDQPIEGDHLDPHPDVRTLVRRFRRDEWVMDIHGWRLNPAHIIAVRVVGS